MKVAFIGSGSMAREHAGVFSRLSGVEVVGVQSPTADNREKFSREFDTPSFSSIYDLYENTNPDALVVCVPPDKVRDVLKSTIAYPAIQLVEKPVGLNTLELQELIRLESEIHSMPKIFAALNRRHYFSVKKLKHDILKSVGSVHLTVVDQENVIEARAYGHNEAVLENWEFANSIHLIDLIQFLCRGNVVNVDTEANSQWNRYSPSVKIARIEFDSGDTCVYQGIWNRPAPWTITASLNSGYFTLKPIEALEMIGPESRETIQLVEKSNGEFKPGLMEQALSFMEAPNGESFDLPTLKDCLDTYLLIDKIYG
jgi:predicted dehydrogenase